MYRLLAVVVVFTLAALAMLGSSARTSYGYHIGGFFYLYHPTGYGSSPATLTCGWHTYCSPPDTDISKHGLDWIWQPPSSSNEVWVRLRGVGNANVKLATAHANDAQLSECWGVRTKITHPNQSGLLFGDVWSLHVDIATNIQSPFYMSTTGYNNALFVGEFLDSLDDPCSSFDHVFQFYQSGPYDTVWSKNGPPNIPNESGCAHYWAPPCLMPFSTWTVAEYSFGIDLAHQ